MTEVRKLKLARPSATRAPSEEAARIEKGARKVRLSIWVTPGELKAVKAHVLEEDTTIQELVMALLRERGIL